MFYLDPSSGVPLYRQLMDQIKRLVAGGQLLPGDTLPSVRDLAAIHTVNPMTISKAYNLLESEGVLTRLRGKSMQVAPQAPVNSQLTQALLLQPLTPYIEAAKQLGLQDSEILAMVTEYLDKN